ncbi:MAG: FHA domain-containing protein [Myxococcota bacterium]|nr:FHA domain-containing protein [Myxococcota bacterium]
MIKLELRNPKTQKTVFVETRGAVFGREGGDADIQLADQGVSKKHARIYARKGEWFLEDLNSANGTYLDGQKLSQPVLLEPGASFTLSRQTFEVIQVVEEEAEVTQAPRADMLLESPGDADEEPSEQEEEEQPEEEEQDEEQDEAPPQAAPSRRPGASQVAARSRAPARSAARGAAADHGFDLGYLMAAVPKALAHYLAAIPLMLVNPVGFVKKGLDQPKFGAMGRMELIAYAFPPYAAYALLVFAGSVLAQLAAGALSLGAILPIGPLITAVVAPVVMGFIWHPVLAWIVSKLGGDSDEASRSNMFVAAMTTFALMAVPAAVAGVLAFVPVAVLGLLPILLQAVVTLITLYVYFAWFQHFGVMKWFQYGLLALAALSVLGIVGSSVAVISATLSGGGSASMASTGSGDGAEEVPEEWKSALAAAEASGNEEMIASVRSQMRESMAQMKAAGEPADDSQPSEAEEETVAAKATADGEVRPASATVGVANKKEPVKLDMPPPPPPVVVAAAVVKVAPVRGMAYPEYKKKLTAIESAIGEDPTLLQRVDGLLPLYQSMHREQHEAEEKMKAAQRKSQPWQTGVNTHLRDAEVYKQTQELVGRVHAKMFQ